MEVQKSATDPAFLGGGVTKPKSGGRRPIIVGNFLQNCMKIKEIGPRGGRVYAYESIFIKLQHFTSHHFHHTIVA